MKTTKSLLFMVSAILSLMTTSCVKDNLNTGNKLNGYWYLSSYQRILLSSGGVELQSLDMSFSESNSPRYMSVSGARFVPYHEQDNKHGWSGWEYLNFTPGFLFTFSLNVEADNSHFKTDINDNVIRLYGETSYNATSDLNGDGVINGIDAVSPDGFGSIDFGLAGMRDVKYNPSVWIKDSEMPVSATFVLVYTKTEKSHFDNWYQGDY